ncbi:MAG TPA: YXWGXW repeat-containing protein [Polyangia bacterium]|jgi:hypothetical protein
MSRALAILAVLAGGTVPATGCFRGDGRIFADLAFTGLVAAAIISSIPPPPPRVVEVPPPRPGWVWQPGYWILQDGQWVWAEGRWVAENPGYQWAPAHWEQQSDGSWRLVPGQWVPLG